MLESTQRSVFRHYLAFDAKKPSSENPNQVGRILEYCVSPEDTTENAAGKPSQPPRYESFNAQGILKTILWISVSIGLALLIGNFC